MHFLPRGNGASSHVLILCKASISSSIVVIYRDTSELLVASWKFEGSPLSVKRQYATLLFETYSECQAGSLLSQVDRQNSRASNLTSSCTLCFGPASEEFGASFTRLFSISTVVVSELSFNVLLFPSFRCS